MLLNRRERREWRRKLAVPSDLWTLNAAGRLALTDSAEPIQAVDAAVAAFEIKHTEAIARAQREIEVA